MDTLQISLASNQSKLSKNSSIGINVNLNAKKRSYADTNIVGTVNAFDRYTTERANCNKVRLVCPINSVCSNILFNPVTEIVKNEGANDTILLNYTELNNSQITDKNDNHPIKSEDFYWNEYEAVRDTQLNSNNFGFDYHCGADIFNNHLLRSDTFKIISYNSYNSKTYQNPSALNDNKGHVYLDNNFNTIDDWMRDSEGNIVLNNFWDPVAAGNVITYYYEADSVKNYNNESHGSSKEKFCSFNVYIHLRSNDSGAIQDIINNNNKITLTIKFDFQFIKSNLIRTYAQTQDYDMDNGVIQIKVRSTDKNEDANTIPKIFSMEISSSSSFVEGFEWKYVANGVVLDNILTASHMYQSYEVDTYDYTLSTKLIEDNGWFGFKNATRLPSYDSANHNFLDISKVINSSIPDNFIDMYPTRELYSFKPLYNKDKQRIEKNWDYCITYPFSSTTNNIEFIDKVTQGLKILMFDEFIYDDSQREVITFYCVSQHGLKVGDNVNIYSTVDDVSTLLIGNAEVADVYNKYIFQIYKNSISISNKWYGFENDDELPYTFTTTIDDKEEIFTLDVTRYDSYLLNDVRYYVLPDSKRINLDTNLFNLSFKKVENNMECSYYVRLFSKLPNFKFSDEEINGATLYGGNTNLINKYRKNEYAFESHINSLGFAKNIYNDPISEIVFTDDIDLSYLKDNLGRPLSEIYLTIIKRNKGYKDWYGINKTECNVSNSDIEYSHCFGKNTCGFVLSDEAKNEPSFSDVRKLGKYGENGLNMQVINGDNFSNFDEKDEIDIDTCDCFYGDLCCYSPSEALETSIQPVMDRFNTAQRELTKSDASYSAFSEVAYDEIINDEATVGYMDSYNIEHSIKRTYDALPRKEGYYYKMHYNIPIKIISDTVTNEDALQHELTAFVVINTSSSLYRICTKEINDFSLNDKVTLYDLQQNRAYQCVIDKILTSRKFECVIFDEHNQTVDFSNIADLSNFIIVAKDEITPVYANLLMDGSLKYCWRDITNTGLIEDDNIETYPFVNGAFYINRPINLYLRRQDPHDELGTNVIVAENNNNISYEPKGEKVYEDTNTQENNYVDKKNMKEC